jgi:TatD DNase family protein
MFFDTHVHFFDNADLENSSIAIVHRAIASGVDRMIAVGGSAVLNSQAIETAKMFRNNIRAAIGFDRDIAAHLPKEHSKRQTADAEALVTEIESEMSRGNVNGVTMAAIGEIGLDFHYAPGIAEAQIALFKEQLALAARLGMPVIIHSRDADEATLAELRRHAANWTGESDRIGVLHCFTRTEEVAAQLLEMGFYISYSGIVTFRNAAALRETIRLIPDDRLLIETDSPYLAPVPHRGTRCEPMYVRHVAETLAMQRGCSLEHLAELTSKNAGRLFGFPACTE